MNICQEYKVFLIRNSKILMFQKNGLFDGDSKDIERYINKGSARYIYMNKTKTGVEQTLYYFANTTDQYLTQYGEWVHIEDSFNMPTTPVVKAILLDFYSNGQYTTDVKIVTKNQDSFNFMVL